MLYSDGPGKLTTCQTDRPIDPHAVDDLTNRCQVVPCREDDALRMRASADALAAAIAQAAEFPGVSDIFSQKYFN